MYSFVTYNGILINEKFMDILKRNTLDDFHKFMNFNDSNLLKRNKFRSVTKIEIEDKIFYLKRHFWPWEERIKSLVPCAKKEDARNEWNNMLTLSSLGFSTMTPVAFGEEKQCGMPYFSFTLTENLYNAEKLEVFFPKYYTPPLNKEKFKDKRACIKKLAVLARDFHSKGLNHQDFYLGHILISQEDNTFFIIDVKRMHKNKTISLHDKIKDLAQLTYSAKRLEIFTKTDLMKFFLIYTGGDKLTPDNKKLARSIMSKTRNIAKHDAKLQFRKNKLRAN